MSRYGNIIQLKLSRILKIIVIIQKSSREYFAIPGKMVRVVFKVVSLNLSMWCLKGEELGDLKENHSRFGYWIYERYQSNRTSSFSSLSREKDVR